MEVLKVKPWGKDQGDYVLINASDFDPARHVLMDGFNGADPSAFDHDQDGKPGGSKPRRKRTANV